MSNARLSRTTRESKQRITGVWRDRKISAEVPVNPEYLLNTSWRKLPYARLNDVINSGSEAEIWGEY
jgi:hypothetical protein